MAAYVLATCEIYNDTDDPQTPKTVRDANVDFVLFSNDELTVTLQRYYYYDNIINCIIIMCLLIRS